MAELRDFTAGFKPSTATHIADYKAAGFVLIPIPNGKKGPTLTGWQRRESCNPPDNWAQNVGLAHAYSGTMALDLDNVEKALPWLASFGVDLPLLLDDLDAVRIESGRKNRAKLLYRLPEGVEALPSVKYKDAAHDVADFRCGTKGGTTVQDVLPPSIHPDTKKPYTWAGDGSYQHIPTLPPELLKVWQGLLDGSIPNKVNQKPKTKQKAPSATVTPIYRDDINQAEVEDALQWISPDLPYEDWVNVLMALHSTGAAWAFSSADAFSQRGTKYESGDVEKKWRSFTHDAGGIGIKTVYMMARTGGWRGYKQSNSSYNVNSTPDWTNDAPDYGQSKPEKEERPPFTPHVIQSGFLASLADIPQRQYIIKKWLQRGKMTGVYAPGGVGKSIFTMVMAVSVASGKDLLGLGVNESTSVLILNNEDEDDELKRRLGAIMLHYGVTDADIEGRLHYLSGYGDPHVFARKVERYSDDRASTTRVEATKKAVEVVEFCKTNSIGVIFCDPLISTHEVSENSNDEMDKVISIFRMLCHATDAALCVSHHIYKGGSDSESHAGKADSGRGAGGVKDAFRYVWTLAKMNSDTAKTLDIEDDRPRMVRADSGKENFSLSDDTALWFRLESQQIANGDWVGVPEAKNLTPLFDAAADKGQHKKWTAHSVAEAVERLMNGQKEKVSTAIHSKFMANNDVGATVARRCISMISDDIDTPTRIKLTSGVYVDYWIEKPFTTAPWTICRREISD